MKARANPKRVFPYRLLALVILVVVAIAYFYSRNSTTATPRTPSVNVLNFFPERLSEALANRMPTQTQPPVNPPPPTVAIQFPPSIESATNVSDDPHDDPDTITPELFQALV
jgi:hypothetical protein